MGKRVGGWKLQPTLKNVERKNPHDYAVCVYLTCSRFLIARLKMLYLIALRDGERGWAGGSCNPHPKHGKKNPHDYAVCVYLTCSRFFNC